MAASRFVALATLFGLWWFGMLLAGLWVHVPIFRLFTVLLWPTALASWLLFFGLLAPVQGANHCVAPGATLLGWTLALIGSALLLGSLMFIGGFVGDELLALQRFMFELHMKLGGPRRDSGLRLLGPLLSQVGLPLAQLMVPWVAGIAALCSAIRLRARWRRVQLLLFGAVLLPMPLLIPYLLLLFNLPMTA